MITKLGAAPEPGYPHSSLCCADYLPRCRPEDRGTTHECTCGRIYTATLMWGRRVCWYRVEETWSPQQEERAG